MRKFIVEREIPAVGKADHNELKVISRTFNETIKSLGSEIQWVESYVAGDKTFCVFYAPSEHVIRQYADKSSFPVDEVTEIKMIIDPTTTGS